MPEICIEFWSVLLSWVTTDHEALTTVHTTVPPILHCIIASARNAASNLGPSSSHFIYKLFDFLPFFWGDGPMIQARLEVLMVSLSTLLC